VRALSLPGCGCRGAFQFAVMARLAERGERFDVVGGASSGSICGAITVAGLSREGPDMWRSMARTPIVSHRYLRTEKSPFGMTAILREALERFCPEDLIIAAEAELLVSTTRVRRFAIEALRRGTGRRKRVSSPDESSIARMALDSDALVVHSNRERTNLHDVIVASCTIPPLYARLPRLDGEIHVDGGAADNTLIASLLSRGATEVTVITPYMRGAVSPTLFESERPPTVPGHVRLRLIHPARPIRLGRFDFTPHLLEEALTMPHVEIVTEPTQPVPTESGVVLVDSRGRPC